MKFKFALEITLCEPTKRIVFIFFPLKSHVSYVNHKPAEITHFIDVTYYTACSHVQGGRAV